MQAKNFPKARENMKNYFSQMQTISFLLLLLKCREKKGDRHLQIRLMLPHTATACEVA